MVKKLYIISNGNAGCGSFIGALILSVKCYAHSSNLSPQIDAGNLVWCQMNVMLVSFGLGINLEYP